MLALNGHLSKILVVKIDEKIKIVYFEKLEDQN